MSLPVAGDASATRRAWPVTAALTIVAILVMVFTWFSAGITMSPFFGQLASRDDYISGAMAYLTTLPVFAGMIWCGWQRGSRAGLVLIALAGVTMASVGLQLLAKIGPSFDVDRNRTPNVADAFGDLTRLNWAAVVVLVAIAVTTEWLRPRARRAPQVPAAQS